MAVGKYTTKKLTNELLEPQISGRMEEKRELKSCGKRRVSMSRTMGHQFNNHDVDTSLAFPISFVPFFIHLLRSLPL